MKTVRWTKALEWNVDVRKCTYTYYLTIDDVRVARVWREVGENVSERPYRGDLLTSGRAYVYEKTLTAAKRKVRALYVEGRRAEYMRLREELSALKAHEEAHP